MRGYFYTVLLYLYLCVPTYLLFVLPLICSVSKGYTLFAFSHVLCRISHVAAEKAPQTPRRPLTAVTSLKIPNLTTRPIRALLRCSQPPRTGVYNRRLTAKSLKY